MEFNIADLFESVADAIPHRIALSDGDRRLTFAELDERASRLANALLDRGIRAGEHIGMYLYNSIEFVEVMLAAFKIRAVPININYRYLQDELAFLCNNADLVALVHQRELTPRIAAIIGSIPSVRTFVAVNDGSVSGPSPIGALDCEALLSAAPPSRTFEPRSGKDLYIIYTGGTTGMPRGVMWQHEDVFFAGLQGGNMGGPPIARPEELARAARERSAPMVILPAAPLIHGNAQWAVLIALFNGGKVVLSAGRSYEPDRVCRLIETERVNTLSIIGDAMARPLIETLSGAGAQYDLSSLKVIASGGALLSDAVKQELQKLLPSTMILNTFGATESGHQGTALPMGMPVAGRLTFYMDGSNAVFDEQLRPIAPGSGVMGKLARRGRLPIGYYNDPEKTAATFPVIGGERWVMPGDFATVEADGQITVFGRGSMCINTGGEKVFPEEVESVIKAHPGILDVIVVGVPDEKWGSRVAAIVQPRPGTEVTLDGIDAHCRTRIAGYKIPRQLRVVDHVIRLANGKPDYRWAKETALGQPGSG